jgi:gliding motility-associated peptidyl-prolyl isomerase
MFLFVMAFSCKSPNHEKQIPFNPDKVKEPLVEANQNAVRTEDEDINLYIKRQQLNVTRSETGLRYQISKTGSGRLIKSSDLVTLSYTTYAIDGTPIYSSDELGTKFFEIDKNNEVQALDEALKLMRKGDAAHLVIPSHLAYGVAGDGDKIRQRIPIVMKIKVINVQLNNKKQPVK